uniref:C2H2-type domain-containing protein n=1 Tax=Anopheles culicifacies TaxID=139723 RepID=A0A182M760_9DIPT
MCTKSLSCILCGQPNFPSIDALRVSLLKVTARPLKCPICGDELLGLDKLTIHLFGHSLLEEQQSEQSEATDQTVKDESSKPNTTFASSSFKTLRKVRKKATSAETEGKQHLMIGSDGRVGKMSPAFENSQYSSNANHCSECDVGFRNSALLKMHREVFHDSSNIAATAQSDGGFDKRFRCQICPKEFKMKGSLKIHMRVVHDAGSKKICLDSNVTTSRAVQTATDTTLATQGADLSSPCGVAVDTCSTMVPMSIVNAHASLSHFQSPSSPNKETNSTPFSTEAHIIQIIDPRQLAQVVYLPPNSTTTPQASLPAHPIGREAGGVSPQQGKESFSLPSSPQQTQQQGHENTKQWECEVCRKSFTTKYFLKKHNRLHTGKCFRQRVSYLVHRRIHTGLMPYKCSGCDKSFRYKVSQRTHKCPASPPGTVLRKTGDLLQKLLQSSSILPDSCSTMPRQEKEAMFMDDALCNSVVEPSEEDDKRTADYVNRTLDELVKGSYNKLDISETSASSLLYDHQLQTQQMYGDTGMANQLQPLSEQPQLEQSVGSEPNFPRIESLCLLSPSAFDSGQLEDLEGLKLDNTW